MAKISELPAASSIVDGTEVVPIVQSGTTKKSTLNTIKDWLATFFAAKGANSDITSLSALTSINGGQLAGFRNQVINGTCQIAQRSPQPAVLGGRTYGGADRIYVGVVGYIGLSAGTISQQASGGTTSGMSQMLVGATATGTGNILFGTRIEASNALSLSNKTVTFSCMLMHNIGSAVNVTTYIDKANTPDNFAATTNIAHFSQVVADSTYTTISGTVTLTDCSNGLQIEVWFPTGALTTKNILIGDLQLEVGSVATPFEQRPIGLELALCQRYYELARNDCISYNSITSSVGARTKFCVTKRVAPTITQLVNNATFAQTNVLATTSTYLGTDTEGVTHFRTTAAAGAAQYSETVSASAEL